MSDALMREAVEPLRLDSAWRLPEHTRNDGAKVHPLRVISGPGRAAGSHDREELRSLVREILREELRSDFGERVTRSVRQLVRDEVARIVARMGGR